MDGVKVSWTDKGAIKVIKHLRDKYKIKTFVETGTFKGINAELHSKNFDYVLTCEKIEEYFMDAGYSRLSRYDNVVVHMNHSPDFLKEYGIKEKMFYLDAHFYDPKLPKNKRFVVLDELKALKNRKDIIIIIHDFDNGLGHITYDGQPLNLELVRKGLNKVNPKFKLYTNTLEGCDPVTTNVTDIKQAGLHYDMETLDNLNYAWTAPRLTYRGLLYALPKKLSKEELNDLGLRELK